MKILVKFPTRNRPERFLSTFSKFIETQTTDNVKYLITLDRDDHTVTEELINQIQSKTKHVTVSVGISKGKIHACNRGINIIDDWDIVILASDDMIPHQTGWDEIIIEAMQDNHPDLDGVLYFSDGYTALNTMCILGRKYFERFGYIYHPEYISLWCDNEFQEVSQMLGKEAKFSQILFRHEHPANTGGANNDALYRENDKFYGIDKATFDKRKAINFEL